MKTGILSIEHRPCRRTITVAYVIGRKQEGCTIVHEGNGCGSLTCVFCHKMLLTILLLLVLTTDKQQYSLNQNPTVFAATKPEKVD